MLPAIEIRVLSIRAVLYLFNRFQEFQIQPVLFYLTVFGEILLKKGSHFLPAIVRVKQGFLSLFSPNTSTLNPSVTFYTLGMSHM